MSTSTPTRKEQREAARAERRQHEEEARLHAQRKRRLMYLGGGLAALIAIVAIVIAVASGGGSSSKSTGAAGGGGVKNAVGVKTEFAGLQQQGNVLGSATAKATLMVFADMQCPFCGEFERGAFPKLVQRYVKTGKVKVIFQPISILGSQSVVASKAVAAAAQQNRMFDYASLFYDNQGQENTGYVTEAFLTKLAKATPGLDLAKWKADLSSARSSTLLAQAQSAAQTAGISSTPSFLVAKRGQALEAFQVSSLDASAFYGKLDSLSK